MSIKKYIIKVTDPQYWEEIHSTLCGVSCCEHIPDREVVCYDEKIHSPTRGSFELTEEEADSLKNHPYIQWIELDPTAYPELYPQPECATKRFKTDVKIYRDLGLGNMPPASNPTSVEANRTSWGITRVGFQTNGDFWSNVTGSVGVRTSDINYSLTGKNVDIMIQDSAVLQYHPEFMKADGQSRVSDLLLDGPYYIDPNYFNNVIPGVKYTKADGRVGIATTAAKEWWSNSAKRSVGFSTIGTVVTPLFYNAEQSVGTNLTGVSSITNGHGTSAASICAGKNFGLAFEANIWNVPAIEATNGLVVEFSFDMMKLFHLYKPVNTSTGIKNPTIVNGSWGYFPGFTNSAATTVSYKFRGTTGTFLGNASTTSLVTAMKNGLIDAQGGGATVRFSSNSGSSSTDEAGNELINAGVIFVAAAGNQNQRLGIGLNDPDLYNYMSAIGRPNATADFPANTAPCNHRNWTTPQGIGYDQSTDFHPVVCVGAMDDTINSNYSERKAIYSNNGPGIDVWAPADDMMSAGLSTSTNSYNDYQRYDNSNFYDNSFNGTSAAAPVVTGLISLYLESNPRATSKDVKKWLKTHGSVAVSTSLYQDQYTDDTQYNYWTQNYNMRGAEKRIAFNPFANDVQPSISNIQISGISFTQS